MAADLFLPARDGLYVHRWRSAAMLTRQRVNDRLFAGTNQIAYVDCFFVHQIADFVYSVFDANVPVTVTAYSLI
jgi:hypothetical protein